MERQVAGRRRTDHPEAEELAAGWYRGGGEVTTRDGVTALLLGGAYGAVTLAISAGARTIQGTDLVTLVVLVGLYVLAQHTEFESSAGSAVPTEPVLVGMLFLVPRPLVPMTVLMGLLITPAGRDREPGPLWRTLMVRTLRGWHCIGPVMVLWNRGGADLRDWRIYLVALGAQFAIDAVVGMIRAWALGVDLRELIGPMAWTFATDALLAPLGLSAVLAADGHQMAGFVLLSCPVLLTRLLAYDRRVQVKRTLSLGEAVVEAEEEARTDVLSTVGNRRAWQEALETAERYVADSPGRRATMALLDLDDLKLTNDTLGHAAGDGLIAAAGRALLGAVPADAIVARIGGDEFAVLIVGDDGVPGPEELAQLLRRAIDRTPIVDGAILKASLGTASCPPAPTVGIAAQWADAAVYAEKATRRRR